MLREGTPIKHHITSSIWSNIKSEIDYVTSNIRFVLGNGCNTNFWLDSWSGPPLMNLIQDHDDFKIHTLVSDFLHHDTWNFPNHVINKIPNLSLIANPITIPLDNIADNKIWIHSNSGDLTLKEAFTFKYEITSSHHWTKHIWNADIPSSKAFYCLEALSQLFANI